MHQKLSHTALKKFFAALNSHIAFLQNFVIVKRPKNADRDLAKAFTEQRSARTFRRQVDYNQTVYTKKQFRREIRKQEVVDKLGGFKLWGKKVPIN